MTEIKFRSVINVQSLPYVKMLVKSVQLMQKGYYYFFGCFSPPAKKLFPTKKRVQAPPKKSQFVLVLSLSPIQPLLRYRACTVNDVTPIFQSPENFGILFGYFRKGVLYTTFHIAHNRYCSEFYGNLWLGKISR